MNVHNEQSSASDGRQRWEVAEQRQRSTARGTGCLAGQGGQVAGHTRRSNAGVSGRLVSAWRGWVALHVIERLALFAAMSKPWDDLTRATRWFDLPESFIGSRANTVALFAKIIAVIYAQIFRVGKKWKKKRQRERRKDREKEQKLKDRRTKLIWNGMTASVLWLHKGDFPEIVNTVCPC